jgi:GNAT superfamily N-acetyltransferase
MAFDSMAANSMQIRPAQPSDALAVARVHVRSWQAAYRGLLPENYLSRLQPEERAKKYDFASIDPKSPKTIVAVERDTILGFATTSPSRDRDLPEHGELCALYVAPDHWGRGVGGLLIAEARRHLLGQGFAHALLWMMAGNQRADRFYRKDKWSPDGQSRSEKVWEISVPELRYQRVLTDSFSSTDR